MGGDVTAESEYGKGSVFTASIPQRVVDSRPLDSVEIKPLPQESKKQAEVKFIAPGVHILAVDDIETNLTVLSGLLAPYQMRLTLCTSGEEAVELVKNVAFDFVLMDHMMPGMDGVEAVARIRAWEESRRTENPASASGDGETKKNPRRGIPIIALTANAVSGMREMFLEQGFDDFLSKPIEIEKLDELIAKWTPAEKKLPVEKGNGEQRTGDRENETPPDIPGVDVKQGVNMTGGTLASYRKVLAQFHKDAQERLALLQAPPEPDALPVFVTQAHAIKSAAGTIGAVEVSREAAALEAAGKAGDTGKIREILPGFYKHLEQLIEGIVRSQELGMESEEWRVQSEESEGKIGPHSSLQTPHSSLQTSHSSLNTSHSSLLNPHSPLYTPQLLTLKEALEAKNMKEIDKLLEEIEWLSLDAETRERINVVSDKVLMGEYEGAIAVIESIMAGETGK
jgi:CheY-like chemotaxis protein